MRRQPGSPAIRVAVAAPFPEMVRIHESTSEYADELEVCAMISSPDAVLEQTRLLQPDVLLLSDELGPGRADTLTRLEAAAPATRLVMMVGTAAGAAPPFADGLVAAGAPPAELRAAILAAVGRGTAAPAPPAHSRVDLLSTGRGRLRLATAADTAATSGPASPAAVGAEPAGDVAPAPPTEPTARGRTVVVFSGKGGVGKSVVAVNLATTLSARGATVALVDLSLQYGDVGVLLHLETHPLAIDGLVQHGDDVDDAALEDALATSADGVRVLLAPTSPEASDLVTPAALEAILRRLGVTHDYVVVDAPAHLEERVVAVLEVADHILLVSSFGMPSVKDTKLTLRLLQSLGVHSGRVALVVNQTAQRVSFPTEDIAGALRFPILSTLPYDARMEESVASGRPLVATEPRCDFSRQLALVADLVSAAEPASAAVRRHAAHWRLRLRR